MFSNDDFSIFCLLFKNDDANNTLEIMNLMVPLNNAAMALFIICEFGERIRMTFHDIDEGLDRLKWYLLPLETQKMLSTIYVIAQTPIRFEILGSVSCDRITFKEVSSTSHILKISLQLRPDYNRFTLFRLAIKYTRHLWCCDELLVKALFIFKALGRQFIT